MSYQNVPGDCMQANKPAKGPTAEEFCKDVLCPVLEVAKNTLSEKLGEGVHPLISFDNDRIHTSALKRFATMLHDECGWDAATMRCSLSPYSPDIHRVIEHTHGAAMVKFRQWLYANPKKHTVEEYKAAFEAIYRECCSPTVIAADVAGMPEVYKAVVKNNGGWAPRELR